MTLEVLKPQEFVITVDEVNTYQDGETFTIQQISDFVGTTNNSRTFEFTRTGAVSGNNIPVFIDPEYRVPDLARSIAAASTKLEWGISKIFPTESLDSQIRLPPSPQSPSVELADSVLEQIQLAPIWV